MRARVKRAEEEPKGVKRSICEWEEFAKKLKTKAAQRAEESTSPGEAMDGDRLDVIKEIGAVSCRRGVQ